MNTARAISRSQGIRALSTWRYSLQASRSIHMAPSVTLRKKEDLMDRESMNPTSTEYSKTGEGDAAAAHDSVAFDPKTTDPEAEHDEAGQRPDGNSENPLNMSPGSPERGGPGPQGAEASKGASDGAAGGKASHGSSGVKRGQ